MMPYKSLAPVKMDVETEKAAGGYANSSQKATLPRLSRYQTFLFSITCAIAVANIYFAQPLLESMAASLAVSSGIIGIVVTATQAGYAVGLLFIVPLGDLLNRKKIILTQMLLSALALCAVGMAQNWIMLLGAMVLVGLMAVVVQVVVAYAATLASPEQRGEAVGTVTSGIVLGILLARFVSGAVADLAGWRGVYFVSAALMVCMALVLFRTMPASTPPPAKDGYWKLLRSMFQLYLTERSLRVRGTFALLIFAAFSVLWTSMVLPLSAPPLSLSHTQIGLFGLAGVAGVLAAARAGRLADKGFGNRTTGVALALLTLSWLPIAFVESSLLAMVVGVVLLDFAVQAVHVTNQSLIFASRPDAQSRLVGAYMCFYSIGSGLGAVAATYTYAHFGWGAVCALGAAISAIAMVYWIFLELTPP
ncbi:Major facilitator transporter [Pseudomonas coronafaciens pv. garcae]|uniref:Major facilitator transporter n=5 Tax=Pseudomonas syringae group TaxID=136849 RepID=A0AB37QRB4_9PSED|nr:Major facilitator transporter [Pseudomonas coronafaciens pv. striafaciens]RMN34958.1 Major facilitator transporter [Pseudomonas coronafaciens pv. zizaniae]RMP33253.1 Major facilitator transporter [Pseudomonas coronafaciens pv. atropurpurea]RMS02586.1 Major facilitator transporter [Pseudomonas coronafaciens pv. garcae]RMS10409.1 Major facilitator transporter [Pseudomonas coronafaciens pv. coronafaciens]RMU86018.1 Major facilitator transporter [Pseudomonas coronafaciens pv. porri]